MNMPANDPAVAAQQLLDADDYTVNSATVLAYRQALSDLLEAYKDSENFLRGAIDTIKHRYDQQPQMTVTVDGTQHNE